ncbi:hypothetical protein [Aquibacillus saliphilus]|uniref:hypothetical protein n=1 Tax=Aquibacillus saliphilus TaxID=1909422 RepID=UPI001CF00007|nr:hypothetical protein [Aquibacillus saliphilus]
MLGYTWELHSIQELKENKSIVIERKGWDNYRVFLFNQVNHEKSYIKYYDSYESIQDHLLNIMESINYI